MPPLPQDYVAIIRKRAFAHLATLMPDGSPQVTPVWIDYDGEHILINSAEGRVKDRNMRHDGRVALSILDPDDPYRHISVRGRVVDMTTEGGREHIDQLAMKYWGRLFNHVPGEVRVIYRIDADQITGNL